MRSTFHGRTNLTAADAQHYFAFARLGDIFTYTRTGGPVMPGWDGYGDWNLPALGAVDSWVGCSDDRLSASPPARRNKRCGRSVAKLPRSCSAA